MRTDVRKNLIKRTTAMTKRKPPATLLLFDDREGLGVVAPA